MRGKGVKLHVMGFGLGGNHADGTEQDWSDPARRTSFTSSWYLRPDELPRYICPDHYAPEQIEGCILIDKRAAVFENCSLAFHSPICDPLLPPGGVKRFRDSGGADSAFLPIMAAGFGAVGAYAVAAKQRPDLTGMDYVAPDVYAAWWREHGARMGIVRDGVPVWESPDPGDPGKGA